MREKLESAEGKRLYGLRQTTSEPVFGQIKWNRGFHRFLAKGLEGASAEAALVCMVHNVLKCAASANALAHLTLKETHLCFAKFVLAMSGHLTIWLGRTAANPNRAAMSYC